MEQAEVRRLQGALELPIDQIRPDQGQPRRDWRHDDGEHRLAELVSSIREFGVLQPLLVGAETTGPDGIAYYPLIAGNRRLVAVRQAGLEMVPALVRDTRAADLRVLQLTENLQRQNLAPLDEARAYQELMDLEKLSAPELAARLHVSETLVRNRLHLLDDQVLADAVERRQIAASAARQILQLPDEERARFRSRVDAGERIQTNDLATARARLQAEGVPHPRRSPRPALPLGQPVPRPVPSTTVADSPTQEPATAPATQAARPVDPSEAAVARHAAHEVPAHGRPIASSPDGLAQVLTAADPGVLELLRRLAHYGEAGGADLQALPIAVRLLGDLLRYGIEADLACGALFDLIWSAPHE